MRCVCHLLPPPPLNLGCAAPIRVSLSLVTSEAKICPYVGTFLKFACNSMPISAFKTKILEVKKKPRLRIQQSPALKKEMRERKY